VCGQSESSVVADRPFTDVNDLLTMAGAPSILKKMGERFVHRFHLNVLDGDRLIPDLDGEELRSELEACTVALETAREIMANSHHHGSQDQWAGRSLILTDAAGQELLVLPFSAAA
jgi:hypothetical protein